MSDTPVTPRGSRTRVYALKAAKELFDARGRHATTLSDFTSACGVQKVNLHRHFEAKKDLALALIEKTRGEYLSYRRSIERKNARWKDRRRTRRPVRFSRGKEFHKGDAFSTIRPLRREIRSRSSGQRPHQGCIQGMDVPAEAPAPRTVSRVDLHRDAQPDRPARHIAACLEEGIMLSRLARDGRDVLACIESLETMKTRKPRRMPGAFGAVKTAVLGGRRFTAHGDERRGDRMCTVARV